MLLDMEKPKQLGSLTAHIESVLYNMESMPGMEKTAYEKESVGTAKTVINSP